MAMQSQVGGSLGRTTVQCHVKQTHMLRAVTCNTRNTAAHDQLQSYSGACMHEVAHSCRHRLATFVFVNPLAEMLVNVKLPSPDPLLEPVPVPVPAVPERPEPLCPCTRFAIVAR